MIKKIIKALQDKKNFIIKSLEANYRASLRLDGFTVTSDTLPKNQSIESIIEKH